MILEMFNDIPNASSVPRVGGGDPLDIAGLESNFKCSPRRRG